MKSKLLLLVFLIFPILLSAHTLKGKIIRVSDGDTVVVLDSTNTQHRVRLDGIDCPEKGQPFGTKAANFVKELTRQTEYVIVEWEKKDRYGRILGVLYVGDINVNEKLLENGLAWHYKHFNQDQKLADLEQQAKDKKLNIWSEKNPIEPYQWRKGKREYI